MELLSYLEITVMFIYYLVALGFFITDLVSNLGKVKLITNIVTALLLANMWPVFLGCLIAKGKVL